MRDNRRKRSLGWKLGMYGQKHPLAVVLLSSALMRSMVRLREFTLRSDCVVMVCVFPVLVPMV